MHRSSHPRLTATLFAAALLLVVPACSSSDSSDGAKDGSGSTTSTSTGGTDEGGPDAEDTGSGAPSDPCQWYTAAEMSDLVGATLTMEAEETPVGDQCVYNSDPEFTSLTVRPQTAAEYSAFKSGLTVVDEDATIIEVDGVGDEAWHDNDGTTGNASTSLWAKTGGDAVVVELATAGTVVADVPAAVALTSTVASEVLGG